MRIICALVLLMSMMTHGGTLTAIQHTYKFKLALNVPRVYDNTSSLGYRKYQRQYIYGTLKITYPVGENNTYGNRTIEIEGLYNKTHKDSKGNYITYDCFVEDFCLNLIGDNKKNKFRTAGIMLDLIAEPSYSIGAEVNEDNALFIKLAGKGTTKSVGNGCRVISRISGSVSGTLGCGCTDYGHKSPTRVADYFGPKTYVDDKAPTDGKFVMVYKGSTSIYK